LRPSVFAGSAGVCCATSAAFRSLVPDDDTAANATRLVG
jgi:hypothetical protein